MPPAWPIIVISLLLVTLAASGSLFLKTSTNYRMFFAKDNPQLLALESLENTYGKNDNVLILIVPEDRDFASEQALTAVAWLTDHAWQTPHSTRVDSIANFQHTTADGDDLFVRSPCGSTETGQRGRTIPNPRSGAGRTEACGQSRGPGWRRERRQRHRGASRRGRIGQNPGDRPVRGQPCHRGGKEISWH